MVLKGYLTRDLFSLSFCIVESTHGYLLPMFIFLQAKGWQTTDLKYHS